jgi:preprotein translocase subunit SecD
MMKRKTKQRIGLFIVILLTVFFGIVSYPNENAILKYLNINEKLSVRRGLDLQGGAYLVYEADFSNIEIENDSSKQEVLENAATVIERRINPGGVGETIVRTAENGRIIVELPGVRTAQLTFWEVDRSSGEESGLGLTPTDLSGRDVARANVEFSHAGGARPVITLRLKSGESTQKFSDLTARLASEGGLLAVFLDQQPVFGPANAQHIPNGIAQLTGDFDTKEANEIATLLNAGALPVPINLVAQQSIGPSLGELSVKQSVIAAFIGIFSIILFMIFYYKKAGIVSVFSLVFYSFATVSIIKFSAYTDYVIVLSLAGIAGFILSIAVAVDTNILIFERLKEELKSGQTPAGAFESGFDRAWTSIRDANITTIISCIILYTFGTPAIKGFAVMLGLGVVLNVTTAWTVTKVGMRYLTRNKRLSRGNWIGQGVEK